MKLEYADDTAMTTRLHVTVDNPAGAASWPTHFNPV